MRMIQIPLFFSALFFFGPEIATASDVIELEPIIKRGGSTDEWRGEKIAPVRKGNLQDPKGQAAPTDAFLEDLPLPVNDYGVAGATKQFRGFGRSSEETSVEVFDVPLNPVQGGGFDFSAFPSYLWSDYEFEAGPGPRSIDPAAISGRIALRPWSVAALDGRGPGASAERLTHARFRATHSTARVTQISLAGKSSEQNAAAVVGYSAGDLDGPSGAASFEWKTSPEHRVRLHALGTQVKAKLSGSRSSPTPGARQTTARVIPVLQSEWRPEIDSRFRTSLFFDSQSLRCENCGYTSYDQSRQAGGDTQWEGRGWGVGGNLRHATYKTLTFAEHNEVYYSLRGSRMQSLSESVTVEPALLIKGTNEYGSYPEGQLGFKKTFELEADSVLREAEVYSRLGYARKIPTLLDRYYEIPGVYRGNPSLDPEIAYSVLLGGSARTEQVENALDFFYQQRDDAIVHGTVAGVPTRLNFGTAMVFSATHSLGWTPSVHWRLRNSIAWTQSELTQSGTELIYTPEWMDTLGAEFFPEGEDAPWRLASTLRVSESALANATLRTRVGGYALWNLEVGYRSGQVWSAFGRVENLLDRDVEIIQDYPLLGRIWVLGLEAYL